jgi:hypothetical protein
MKNIILASGAIIVLTAIYIIFLTREKNILDDSQLAISCKGNVHFNLDIPDSTVKMEGSVSLVTLGSKRMAVGFSGQLSTEKGHFTLSRTLIMNSLYHPENHILELNYASSIVSAVDTTSDDDFYHAFMKKNDFILKLSQLSDNALLVSDRTSPLYVCIAQ